MSKFSIHGDFAIQILNDEIHRDDASRYHHRLHSLFLVSQGKSAREVSMLFGDSPRIVQYWVSHFEQNGLEGILEKEREGRPSRLQPVHIKKLQQVLCGSPAKVGLPGVAWDGKSLSTYIESKYHVKIGVRQCQRLLRRILKENAQ